MAWADGFISEVLLFIYFIDLSQKRLHNYTFQIDASKNITLCEWLGRI